jgi:hypothetical protein
MTAKEHLAECEKRSGGATSKERELCAALEAMECCYTNAWEEMKSAIKRVEAAEKERDLAAEIGRSYKAGLAQMKEALEKVAMDCRGGLVDGDVVADEIRAILKGAKS